MAPLGLADWFEIKYGALTFHWGIGVTIFNSRRAAQRAILRTQKISGDPSSEHTMIEFEIIEVRSL